MYDPGFIGQFVHSQKILAEAARQDNFIYMAGQFRSAVHSGKELPAKAEKTARRLRDIIDENFGISEAAEFCSTERDFFYQLSLSVTKDGAACLAYSVSAMRGNTFPIFRSAPFQFEAVLPLEDRMAEKTVKALGKMAAMVRGFKVGSMSLAKEIPEKVPASYSGEHLCNGSRQKIMPGAVLLVRNREIAATGAAVFQELNLPQYSTKNFRLVY
ncbi:MAG: hypothetical protein V1659_01985 [Candidatus Woesearchaeota archaeon]